MALSYNDHEYRLCYVDENVMYFTDNFKGQWGDNWNDAPYEHNAGTPYEWDEQDTARNDHCGHLRYVGYVNPEWESRAETPAELAGDNSPYSVEEINAGAAAWLSIPKRRAHLMAGEAIAWCRENGIKVGELT